MNSGSSPARRAAVSYELAQALRELRAEIRQARQEAKQSGCFTNGREICEAVEFFVEELDRVRGGGKELYRRAQFPTEQCRPGSPFALALDALRLHAVEWRKDCDLAEKGMDSAREQMRELERLEKSRAAEKTKGDSPHLLASQERFVTAQELFINSDQCRDLFDLVAPSKRTVSPFVADDKKRARSYVLVVDVWKLRGSLKRARDSPAFPPSARPTATNLLKECRRIDREAAHLFSDGCLWLWRVYLDEADCNRDRVSVAGWISENDSPIEWLQSMLAAAGSLMEWARTQPEQNEDPRFDRNQWLYKKALAGEKWTRIFEALEVRLGNRNFKSWPPLKGWPGVRKAVLGHVAKYNLDPLPQRKSGRPRQKK